MQKKVRITVTEELYAGLHRVVGARKISRFVEGLVRPNLEPAYAHMARDEKRETQAGEWAEATFKDIGNEAG